MPTLRQISSGLQAFGILDSIKNIHSFCNQYLLNRHFLSRMQTLHSQSGGHSLSVKIFTRTIGGSNEKLAAIDIYKYFTCFIKNCKCSGK